jgi:pantoate--beta-alanine ligase
MGALHQGHMALVDAARSNCVHVAVSIFVNPLQFGAHEDLSQYPRPEDYDLQMCEAHGVHAVFIPKVTEFYDDFCTKVTVCGISELWEGAKRPGHFEGVATVVAKLFNIVRPDFAYFGLKDYQQCRVIAKLVGDLSIPLNLEFVETVREPDGLALSSRNRYLSPEERELAPAIYETLLRLRAELLVLKSDSDGVRKLLISAQASLDELGILTDYLELVDAKNLQPAIHPGSGARLIVAARIGKTRLIDNIGWT